MAGNRLAVRPCQSVDVLGGCEALASGVPGLVSLGSLAKRRIARGREGEGLFCQHPPLSPPCERDGQIVRTACGMVGKWEKARHFPAKTSTCIYDQLVAVLVHSNPHRCYIA